MKCQNCELQYTEYDSSSVVEILDECVKEGKMNVEILVSLSCPNCGTPQREKILEDSFPIEHNCGSEDQQYELFDTTASFIKEDSEDGTRYGAELTFNLRCEYCSQDIQLEKIVSISEFSFTKLRNEGE